MGKEVLNLTLTAKKRGFGTKYDGHIKFEGNTLDQVNIFCQLFNLFEMTDREIITVADAALKLRKLRAEENDND